MNLLSSLHAELALRICVATLLGGIIGYERDLHGRPAGLRTHTLVALASATFMVVSTRFVYFQHYSREDLVAVDTSRIAASVVTGIGFLAGGAILRSGLSVQGLTTAAGLWLVAAIGLASGGGMYFESVLATVVGITALTLLRRFEDKDDRRMVRKRLSLVMAANAPTLDKLFEDLNGLGGSAIQQDFERDLAQGTWSVTIDVRVPSTISDQQLLESLTAYESLKRIRLEPLG